MYEYDCFNGYTVICISDIVHNKCFSASAAKFEVLSSIFRLIFGLFAKLLKPNCVCTNPISKLQNRVATKILRRFWGRATDTGTMIL